jgi:protein translocase SecG subunit
MLFEFLSTLFVIFNILLIILVIMQKNHGGFWSGPVGNDSVVIFGGNQGADVLQKITWAFGFILIFGCLSLSVYQASLSEVSIFYSSDIKEHLEKEKKEKNNEEGNASENSMDNTVEATLNNITDEIKDNNDINLNVSPENKEPIKTADESLSKINSTEKKSRPQASKKK